MPRRLRDSSGALVAARDKESQGRCADVVQARKRPVLERQERNLEQTLARLSVEHIAVRAVVKEK